VQSQEKVKNNPSEWLSRDSPAAEITLMSNWREKVIDAGMGLFCASGAHWLAAPFTRGQGAILTFHHVRPGAYREFAPNRGLEIRPQFLDALLAHLRHRGYRFLSLDQALDALAAPSPAQAPFVALTFDDGYRDLVEFALPVLERHHAPFAAYVTTDFAEGAARLWWVELEEAFARLDRIEIEAGGEVFCAKTSSGSEKAQAFDQLYWRLRAGSEEELLRVAGALCAQAGIEPLSVAKRLCLDWRELALLAQHELATIGAHSVTHARLAKLDREAARGEMAESRKKIAAKLRVEVRHFCYPVGDPTSAGPREFELARGLGFASAVTTRPGVLLPDHRRVLFSLPRISVNGRHQNLAAMDVLLTGAPFAFMNRGRSARAA
jgi:peptidoglycan/xylan/chitin deacetylase (PgdA/CDA1 family)